MRSFRTKLTDFAIFFVPRAVGTAVVLVIVIGLFGWIGLAAAITALSAFFLWPAVNRLLVAPRRDEARAEHVVRDVRAAIQRRKFSVSVIGHGDAEDTVFNVVSVECSRPWWDTGLGPGVAAIVVKVDVDGDED